jgi:hypothetical protein
MCMFLQNFMLLRMCSIPTIEYELPTSDYNNNTHVIDNDGSSIDINDGKNKRKFVENEDSLHENALKKQK